MSAHAPSLRNDGSYRPRSPWLLPGVVAGVVALLVVGALALAEGHHTPGPAAPRVASRAPTAELTTQCPASATIALSSRQNSAGTYAVSVSGIVQNNRAPSMAHVKVTWVVSYADYSTSNPMTTPVARPDPLTRHAHVPWSGSASTNDGPVPPTGVKVIGLSYAHSPSNC